MRVLIHAPAARMGGARTHLLGMVPELAALADPADRFLLLAQPDLLSALPALPDAWGLHPERAEQRGFVGRLLFEQMGLPRIARQWGADVLISFGSFIPLRIACPTVLEAGNALQFTPAYWRWLRGEEPRVQAGEVARWLLLQASLNASTRVLTPSRSMRHDVILRLPRLASRVDVAFWGVARQFTRTVWAAPGTRTILGVSKHGVNKEFDVLVAAFARVRARYPDARLRLTGSVNESRWSRKTDMLARHFGVARAVEWLGDVPNLEIPALLATADVLVFPTWCESFGLPLAEGVAAGVPSVAADIPACREVGGDGALYYHPGDADSLAARVDALLSDRAAARALSARARRRGGLFDWRENARATRASLERAVNQP